MLIQWYACIILHLSWCTCKPRDSLCNFNHLPGIVFCCLDPTGPPGSTQKSSSGYLYDWVQHSTFLSMASMLKPFNPWQVAKSFRVHAMCRKGLGFRTLHVEEERGQSVRVTEGCFSAGHLQWVPFDIITCNHHYIHPGYWAFISFMHPKITHFVALCQSFRRCQLKDIGLWDPEPRPNQSELESPSGIAACGWLWTANP